MKKSKNVGASSARPHFEEIAKNVGAGLVSARKENKGITLIALIITIIVMLILVAVSIQIALNTGLFDAAGKATQKWNTAQDEEKELAGGQVTIGDKIYNSIDDYMQGKEFIDWEAILADANANPEKYRYPGQQDTNKDIGIGTDGKPVKMDLWSYTDLGEEIALGVWHGCATVSPGYSNNDIKGGKIIGTVPAYIKPDGYDEFVPVTALLATFLGCTDLETIPEIPSTVKWIGLNAFANCTGLTNVTIPSTVETLDSSIFDGCTGLTQIKVEVENEWYDSRENCNAIIESETNKLVLGCRTTVIPSSVTSIGNCAFMGCSGLTDITIPSSITSIGGSAFRECSGLTDITIPSSITSIGESAFRECSGLTDITIPANVTSIKSYAFWGCSGLTDITIPANVTSIENFAFSECTGLTNVTIQDGVTEIRNGAFRGCTGLTNITIPSNVTSMEGYVFDNCTSLTDIYCEAASQPSGWSNSWNSNCSANVHWDSTGPESET